MNKQQTAVEWLIEEFEQKSFQETEGINQIHLIIDVNDYVILKEQANKMFEQQIIDAYWGGLNGSINDYSEAKLIGSEMINIKAGGGAEQYYSETFNK